MISLKIYVTILNLNKLVNKGKAGGRRKGHDIRISRIYGVVEGSVN